MLTQMFRYLKGDRIIKSTPQNLSKKELNGFDYPFVLKKLSDDDSYMICGDKSCFANTKDKNKINELINNSF